MRCINGYRRICQFLATLFPKVISSMCFLLLICFSCYMPAASQISHFKLCSFSSYDIYHRMYFELAKSTKELFLEASFSFDLFWFLCYNLFKIIFVLISQDNNPPFIASLGTLFYYFLYWLIVIFSRSKNLNKQFTFGGWHKKICVI